MTVKVAHLFGNEESLRGYVSAFSNLNYADIVQIRPNSANLYGCITGIHLGNPENLANTCSLRLKIAPCFQADFIGTMKARGTLNLILFE